MTFAVLTSTTHPRFTARETIVQFADDRHVIPVPDGLVLCNGCNANIAEYVHQTGWMIYLDRADLESDQPYDIFCHTCLDRLFPEAIRIGALPSSG